MTFDSAVPETVLVGDNYNLRGEGERRTEVREKQIY